MNRHCLLILFISGVIYSTCALSIDCGEFYDDDTISKTWGYVYYSCNGTLVANGSNNRVMELFGAHLHGRNSSYTERIVLNYQNLSSFPNNFDKFFPYLRIIDFSHNCIDSVTHYQLQPHTRLNSLILEHNRISTLDSNLFDGLDQLIDVRLNDNNIKHIGYDIKLPRYIYMNNNPCIRTCCTFFQTFDLALKVLHRQCQPLQSTIRQSNYFSHDVDAFYCIIKDSTIVKDEEPATEEPSIHTKRPKMGEVIHCVWKVLLKEDNEPLLGKRCNEMYENKDHSVHAAVNKLKSQNFKSKIKKKLKTNVEKATIHRPLIQ